MSYLHNTKLISAVLLLLFLLLSAGCTNGSNTAVAEPEPTEEEEPYEPEPTETPPLEIQIGQYSFLSTDEAIDLAEADIDFEELCDAASSFEALRSITLGNTGASADQLKMLISAFPEADISWSVSLLDTVYPSSAEVVDLSQLTDEDAENAALQLSKLLNLHTVQLCSGEGFTTLSFDSIKSIQDASPDADINCRFNLYGLTADWETEELRYVKVKIGDDGIPVFRSALPYLRSLKLLRLERCEIKDYESMAELKNDFPEKNIALRG